MAVSCAVALLGAVLATRSVLALRGSSPKARADLQSYSFAEFSRDFGRSYKPGSDEYNRRATVFQASLVQIHAVNAKNLKEGRPWTAGIHPFMDWTQAERQSLHGYKPSRARGQRSGTKMAVLQMQAKAGSHMSLRATANSTFLESFSWDDQGVGPSIRQQGNCGSCWAISATEAVEAQLQKQGVDPSVRLSAQTLVDCVPNPQHCGGKGGCDGATGELAYSFMRDTGIPLESDHPYTAETGQCPMSSTDVASKTPYPSAKRARVSSWNQLPSNQAEPVMQALVQQGPVVVAVDANSWFDYDKGIFDGCERDAVLGHAVLLKGYGEDKSAGKKYWSIQNSWGPDWGEQGHIRMLRHDDEDSFCGVDKKPQEGVGCDGGPAEVTVCGTCGLLYDPIVPEGVHLDGGDAASSAASAFSSGDNAAEKMRQALLRFS